MKTIQLTNSDRVAIVDDDDFERVSAHNWYINGSGYASSTFNNESVMMHRFIIGANKGEEVDHINEVKLDNRSTNLRLCSHTQNLARRKIQSHNTSGFIGVCYDKINKKYRSYLQINGHHKSLGRFNTAVEAAKIRDLAAVEYFGEYAQLNFTEAQ